MFPLEKLSALVGEHVDVQFIDGIFGGILTDVGDMDHQIIAGDKAVWLDWQHITDITDNKITTKAHLCHAN